MANALPFLIVCLCALCQWFALLLAGHNKPSVWKLGIHIGMGGSGWAAAGFASYERLNPLPWHTFGLSTLFMLSCVVVAYYQASQPDPTATPEQIRLAEDRQHRALFRVGIGIIAVLCVAVIVSFMDGKRAGEKLQAKSVMVLEEVGTVLDRLQTIAASNRARLDARDRADSLFQVQSLTNQKRGLGNQERILKEQATVKDNLKRAVAKPVIVRPVIIYPTPAPLKPTLPTGVIPLQKVQPVQPPTDKPRRLRNGRYGYVDEPLDSSAYYVKRDDYP